MTGPEMIDRLTGSQLFEKLISCRVTGFGLALVKMIPDFL